MADDALICVDMEVEEDNLEFELVIDDIVVEGAGAPIYDGEVEVEPKLDRKQVLETAGKLLKSDVTVDEIPLYITSNVGGGYTYYIGK